MPKPIRPPTYLLFAQAMLGGVSFSPADLAGLTLWLDANDLTTLWQDSAKTTPVAADGDVVGAWEDKSGNANDGSQATAGLKPLYKTNIQNGKAIIRFDGVDDLLSLPGLAGLTAAEFFFVLKKAADPASSAGAGGAWHFGVAVSSHVPWTDGVVYESAGTDTRKTVGNLATDLDQWNLYNVVSRSGEFTVRLNGSPVFTTATNPVELPAAPLLGISFSAHYLEADLAEVLLYDFVLSPAERGSVEAYLVNKWGLSF
jgi:hypothetical protein